MITMDKIISDSNPILREISKEVELPLNKEDEELLRSMHEYLVNSQDEEMAEKYDLRPAVGIAAVQLGVLKRMCAMLVYDFNDEGEIINTTTYALANPKIVSYTQKMAYLKSGEGCLSVLDDHPGLIHRHAKVTIKGYDLLTDSDVTIVARGYFAIVCQHELDHFDGKLFYDYIDPKLPNTPLPGAMAIE